MQAHKKEGGVGGTSAERGKERKNELALRSNPLLDVVELDLFRR